MQIGISTASLFMRLYNEDAIALINEWGVKTAEVFLTSFCEYEPKFARTLLKKKGRLNVNSVHVLNTQFEPQLFSACLRKYSGRGKLHLSRPCKAEIHLSGGSEKVGRKACTNF